ncbi:MAG: hypothetical protein UIM53_02760 [Acutalibacteraceae bacterium]|nr:hypothetical protein [Acutalibacteraceae bacterium]
MKQLTMITLKVLDKNDNLQTVEAIWKGTNQPELWKKVEVNDIYLGNKTFGIVAQVSTVSSNTVNRAVRYAANTL